MFLGPIKMFLGLLSFECLFGYVKGVKRLNTDALRFQEKCGSETEVPEILSKLSKSASNPLNTDVSKDF